MAKECLTIEIKFEDVLEAKGIILPIIKKLNPEDFFYLFYDPIFKVGLVGVTKDQISGDLERLKILGQIENYDFNVNENTWDISKIIACESMKIVDLLQEKHNPLTVENFISEIVNLPEINASSYQPLHFILNQLRWFDRESVIRFKILFDKRYLAGFREFDGHVWR